MKFSFYNHIFTHRGKSYVYNLFSTALLELDNRCAELFVKGELTGFSPEEKEELAQQGFIVDDKLDEAKRYNSYYENARYTSCKTMKLILVPTYACNLACPYCFEGEQKAVKRIEKAGIDSILAFMKHNLEALEPNIPIEKLVVSLFGGEPLLCKKELEYFCSNIEEIAEKHNVILAFDMTSNFTLVDDEVLELIRKHKIYTQVTIDGTKEEHDKRRITRDGRGTYDIILKNLKRANEYGLKDLISIRLNIDAQNIDSVEEALVRIKDYGWLIYYGILQDFNEINRNFKQDCLAMEQTHIALTEKLYPILEKYNLYCPYSFGKKSPCIINCHNKYVVDLSLNVWSCESLVGFPNTRIGFLDGKGSLNLTPNYYEVMNYSPFNFEKCRLCKFLPMCGGSCPASEFLADNNHNKAKITTPVCGVTENTLNMQLRHYIDHLSE